MKKKKNFNSDLQNIDCDQLVPAPYYKELFPKRFGSENVTNSILTSGFKREKPIMVQRLNDQSQKYEILDGVCRWEGALKKNLKTIPAFVLDLNDTPARAYTARENLKTANTGTSLSVVQAIILEREIRKGTGEKNLMTLVMSATSESQSTYKRAAVSLKYAVEKLLKMNDFSDLKVADFTKVVARAVSKNIWEEFTDFYTGKLKPYTFMRMYYSGTETSKIKSEKFGFKNVRSTKISNKEPKPPSLILKETLENLRSLGDFYAGLSGRVKLHADFNALMTPERERQDSPERRSLEYLATEFKRYPISSNDGVQTPKRRSSTKARRQPGDLLDQMGDACVDKMGDE